MPVTSVVREDFSHHNVRRVVEAIISHFLRCLWQQWRRWSHKKATTISVLVRVCGKKNERLRRQSQHKVCKLSKHHVLVVANATLAPRSSISNITSTSISRTTERQQTRQSNGWRRQVEQLVLDDCSHWRSKIASFRAPLRRLIGAI